MPAGLAAALGTAAATAAGAGATTAGLVGAGISAAGALASGLSQSGSVDSGASKASGISQQAITQATANSQPYMTAGTGAVNQLSSALGLNGADASTNALANFTASPGFGYQVEQGLKAVDSGAASRGMLQSGATIKAEQTLGNNLASQDFGAYLGRLNQLATLGNTSATSLNNVLSGQSTNQEAITTGAASQNASIYGNTASGLTSAAKSVPWNSLFGSTTTGAGATSVANLPNGDGTYSRGY